MVSTWRQRLTWKQGKWGRKQKQRQHQSPLGCLHQHLCVKLVHVILYFWCVVAPDPQTHSQDQLHPTHLHSAINEAFTRSHCCGGAACLCAWPARQVRAGGHCCAAVCVSTDPGATSTCLEPDEAAWSVDPKIVSVDAQSTTVDAVTVFADRAEVERLVSPAHSCVCVYVYVCV